MRFFKRYRELRKRRRLGKYVTLRETGLYKTDRPNDGTGLMGEGFFSQGRWKARVASRRKFRVAVSGNRKWIFIGIAVVAVCGTIIYLSIVYGGGVVGLLL